MFNFMKKKADKAKTHNEIYLEVGTRLEQAKASNCLIIEMQARKLRDGNDRKLTAEERNRTYLSIKSAYYALFMIKIVRDRLFELQMNQELAKGMNEITEAMHLLDQLAANAQKPHLLRFQGLVRKMQKSSDGEVAMMKKMGETYTKTCSINQMVDNEVVKLIQEGVSPWECVMENNGIHAGYSFDSGAFDFSQVNYSDDADVLDISQIDLSDLPEGGDPA